MSDSVVLLCPVASDLMPVKAVQTILSAVSYAASKGVEIHHVGMTSRELIDAARNGLAEAFLQTKAEWAFWVDSDQTIPHDTIVELLRVAKEKQAHIVTGIYYQRLGNHFPVLWARDEELEIGGKVCDSERAKKNKYVGNFVFPGKEVTEPFTVHSAGFGCILVHRNVFEVLPKPWFKTEPHIYSEDFYFLVNAREKGYKTWAVPTLDIGHIGEAPVVTKKDFWNKVEKSDLEVEALKQENV
jgi:GT2 family glycosyltransferase